MTTQTKLRLVWHLLVSAGHSVVLVLCLSTMLGWHDRTTGYRVLCGVLAAFTLLILHEAMGRVSDDLDDLGDERDTAATLEACLRRAQETGTVEHTTACDQLRADIAADES